MDKPSELKKVSQSGYKLLALAKAAMYASEDLETAETAALFELAYDLSDRIVVFLQNLEVEEKKNAK